jgi:hypothetical protein
MFVFHDTRSLSFETKVKGDGWEDMLISVLVLWVHRVVDERRLYH